MHTIYIKILFGLRLSNSSTPQLIFHDSNNCAGASVKPVSTVGDLGVYIDSDLGAATHVRRTVSRCFAALRQFRLLRRYVTNDCFCSLVVSLVHSRFDYGNFVFVGLSVYLQRRLQAVLKAAARLVFRLRRYDHVSDALAVLHWLRLPELISFSNWRSWHIVC